MLPTVTDAHVVLGHITAGTLSGGVTLNAAAARNAVDALARQLEAPVERVARAMIEIADASVARALRRVSVERGVDPRGCVLVPFGGGGPLHCCGLAEALGMSRIFVPPHAGALSALGLAITAERRERLVSVLRLVTELDAPVVERLLEDAAAGVTTGEHWERRWSARTRYSGQGHELDVPVRHGEDGHAIARRFSALHRERNGFVLDSPVEIVALRHVASGPAHPVRFARHEASAWRDDHRVDDGGTFGARISGGDVVALPGATLRVARGWWGVPHPTGGWLLEHAPG
jgi:N-methylhydantoinase A/oxoprolinase/acetone carboxylase beta subunit